MTRPIDERPARGSPPLQPPDAQAVLTGLQARDPRVQADTWRAIFPRLVAVCTAVLGDRARAEEMAQDVWIDFAYNHVDRVQHARALYPYLRLMAVRRARRSAARRARFRREGDPPETVGVPDEQRMLGALDARMRADRLAECLDGLTPRARQMLRQRIHREESLSVIGRTFGISKQAVDKAIRKALAALRACLGEGGTA